MAENRVTDIQALRDRVDGMAEYLHVEAKRDELAKLDARSAEPGFWDDQATAQGVMAQAAGLRDEIESYESLVAALDDTDVANELAVAEDDAELAAEVVRSLADLSKRTDALEVSSWFTGEFDSGDAIVTITPGQGGLEAFLLSGDVEALVAAPHLGFSDVPVPSALLENVPPEARRRDSGRDAALDGRARARAVRR